MDEEIAGRPSESPSSVRSGLQAAPQALSHQNGAQAPSPSPAHERLHPAPLDWLAPVWVPVAAAEANRPRHPADPEAAPATPGGRADREIVFEVVAPSVEVERLIELDLRITIATSASVRPGLRGRCLLDRRTT